MWGMCWYGVGDTASRLQNTQANSTWKLIPLRVSVVVGSLSHKQGDYHEPPSKMSVTCRTWKGEVQEGKGLLHHPESSKA